jgi:hypothetical protein
MKEEPTNFSQTQFPLPIKEKEHTRKEKSFAQGPTRRKKTSANQWTLGDSNPKKRSEGKNNAFASTAVSQDTWQETAGVQGHRPKGITEHSDSQGSRPMETKEEENHKANRSELSKLRIADQKQKKLEPRSVGSSPTIIKMKNRKIIFTSSTKSTRWVFRSGDRCLNGRFPHRSIYQRDHM